MCHFRGLYKPLKTTSSKNYVLHHSVCYRYLLCYVGGQHAPEETSPQPTLLQEVGADVCAVLHHRPPGVQGVCRVEGVV